MAPVQRGPRSRQFRRRPYRTLGIVAALAALSLVRYWSGPPSFDPSNPPAEGAYQLVRVVDGDTLIVAPHATIRLIGVNTPETVKPDYPVEPWGKEATEFTRQFVASGTVRLAFDRERVDRFGRFLAYVWVGDQMLNEELLRQGLARYEKQFHYSEAVKQRFRQAEKEARQARRGLWSDAQQP